MGTRLSFSFPYCQGQGDSLTCLIIPDHTIAVSVGSSHSFIFGCANLSCALTGKGSSSQSRRFYFFCSLHLLDLRLTCGPSPPSHPPIDYNMSFFLPASQWAPKYGIPQIPMLLDTIPASSSNYRTLHGTVPESSTHLLQSLWELKPITFDLLRKKTTLSYILSF